MALALSGRWRLRLRRKGKVIFSASGRNLVTSVGENHAAGRFALTGPPTAMGWIALGDGDTAPLKSDTDLENELTGTRGAFDTDSVSGNILTYERQYTHSGGDITVEEIGVFNNASMGSGDMAARFLTQTFEMTAGDILDITWALEFEGVE